MIVMAPMDGYTDSAMRQLVKTIEPRTICFTEFLSSDYFFHKPKEAKGLLFADKEKEYPLIVQLFGKEPEHFAVAARIAQEEGAAGIDINMGCPAKKVVNSMHGAYLMTNVELGCRIIEAVKKVVTIPVSVKTRRGWSDDKNLIPFVTQLIEAGIDLITIHGRTYNQAFSGEADWSAIHRLKAAVSIPVIGNGDIKDAASAKARLGPLDGMMVGRGCMGNPWVFKELASCFYDQAEWNPQSITLLERLDTMLLHASLLVQTKGLERGIMESRKHMASYIRGIPGAAEFRNRLVRIQGLPELEQILSEIRSLNSSAPDIQELSVLTVSA